MDNRLQCQNCSSTDLKKNFWGTYQCNVCHSRGYRSVTWFGDFHNTPRRQRGTKKPIRPRQKKKPVINLRITAMLLFAAAVAALYFWAFTSVPQKEKSKAFEFGKEAIETDLVRVGKIQQTKVLIDQSNISFIFIFENNGRSAIKRPRLQVRLLDQEENLITQRTAFAMRGFLNARETTAIRLRFDHYENYDSYRVMNPGQEPADSATRPNLTIEQARMKIVENKRVIEGIVKNLDQKAVDTVYLYGLVFDEGNKIAALEFGKNSQKTLQPGASDTFKIVFSRLNKAPARFQLEYEAAYHLTPDPSPRSGEGN